MEDLEEKEFIENTSFKKECEAAVSVEVFLQKLRNT